MRAAASGRLGSLWPLDRAQYIQDAGRLVQVRAAHSRHSTRASDAAVAAHIAALRCRCMIHDPGYDLADS